MPVSDEWIGTLLLAGLPEEYAPMIMGIESAGVKISCDSIKTKLLQDVKKSNGDGAAFFLKTKKKPDAKKGYRCYNCNKYGHKAADCRANKQQKYNNKQVGFCTVFATGAINSNKWYVDSGASMHMTMKKDWFIDIKKSNVEEVFVASKHKLDVHGVGDVKININNNNGDCLDVTVHNVLYVPGLTANLLSVRQMLKKGFVVEFKDDKCTILKDNIVVATA